MIYCLVHIVAVTSKLWILNFQQAPVQRTGPVLGVEFLSVSGKFDDSSNEEDVEKIEEEEDGRQ